LISSAIGSGHAIQPRAIEHLAVFGVFFDQRAKSLGSRFVYCHGALEHASMQVFEDGAVAQLERIEVDTMERGIAGGSGLQC
jgi:hypothetical protein